MLTGFLTTLQVTASITTLHSDKPPRIGSISQSIAHMLFDDMLVECESHKPKVGH